MLYMFIVFLLLFNNKNIMEANTTITILTGVICNLREFAFMFIEIQHHI